MTIVLTGDVHQRLRGTADQRLTDRTEPELAWEYARIADEHELKITLFCTARALVQDPGSARTLSTMENVEIAGHGWDALRPVWWHRGLKLLTGSPHGPPRLQQRMIRRTCTVISNLTGKPVRSWRNHAYRHDEHTPRLLASAGISVWSDAVDQRIIHPVRHSSGVIVLPVNTLPDHENVAHVPNTDAVRSGAAMPPSKWCRTVCEQIERIVARGGTATILAHPICMHVADNWKSYQRLCRFLSHFTSRFASEAVPDPDANPDPSLNTR